MGNVVVIAGAQSRIFSNNSVLIVAGSKWVPEYEAINYVKTEEIKITRNGTYYPPKGTFYSKVKVNIRKKKKGGSGSGNGEGSPTSKDIMISQVRTSMMFSGVQKLTTTSSDGGTISWIPEEDAPYYVKAEALNVSDNDIYIPDEGTLYNSVTVNVEFDDDDPTDPDNPGGGDNPGGKTELKLITKEITANGTYTAADEGVDGYSSVMVSVNAGEFYPCDLPKITTNRTYIPYGNGYNQQGKSLPRAFTKPFTVEIKAWSDLQFVTENTTYIAKEYPKRSDGKGTYYSEGYRYENSFYDFFSSIRIAIKNTYQVRTIASFQNLCAGIKNYLSTLNYSISGLDDYFATFDTSECDCFDCSIVGADDVTTREGAFMIRESFLYRITITIRGFRLLQELPFMTMVKGRPDSYGTSKHRVKYNCYRTYTSTYGYAPFYISDGFNGVRQCTATFDTKDTDELERSPIATSDVFTKKNITQNTLDEKTCPYIGILEFEKYSGVWTSAPKTMMFGTINTLVA